MKKRILIADDEPDLREIFQLQLEDEGYQIFEAGNGKEAREIVETELPNSVLLDLRLPDEVRDIYTELASRKMFRDSNNCHYIFLKKLGHN